VSGDEFVCRNSGNLEHISQWPVSLLATDRRCCLQ
jgi:hypothetical protein